MTPTIFWPEHFPAALLSGRKNNVVSPMIRTEFASGRSRARRKFTAVPVIHNVSWLFKTPQLASEFEQWFAETLQDGTEWFGMELVLPQGKGPWPFQFQTIYSGPDMMDGPVGRRWVVEAELVQWLRAK